jgi:hypothetical protein
MPISDAIRSRIVELLKEGATNRAIARELNVDKSTPAHYRRLLGIAPATRTLPRNRSPLTIEQKWATYTRPAEGDGGHLEWTGRRTKVGATPVMTYRERTHTARIVAFRIRHGRDPIGYVKPECGRPDCVAPDHLEDEQGRNRVRSQFGALLGRTPRITECTRGHAVATHRRYASDGTSYCGTCHEDANRARRAAG